ncbi:MAG: EamA domain-containing protein [Oscillospiraceae bacterium]|jgi:drug/metabolite transporter (DMT)-like permease
MSIYWPIVLIVLSNTFYHICAKSMPNTINPMASLTITYLTGAVMSGILYFVLNPGENLLQQYTHLNWTPFVLGISIVGLELGNIFMYKMGWNINTGYIVQSVILAVVLLFVGFLFYKEMITWSKVVGIAICMVGLYFITK